MADWGNIAQGVAQGAIQGVNTGIAMNQAKIHQDQARQEGIVRQAQIDKIKQEQEFEKQPWNPEKEEILKFITNPKDKEYLLSKVKTGKYPLNQFGRKMFINDTATDIAQANAISSGLENMHAAQTMSDPVIKEYLTAFKAGNMDKVVELQPKVDQLKSDSQKAAIGAAQLRLVPKLATIPDNVKPYFEAAFKEGNEKQFDALYENHVKQLSKVSAPKKQENYVDPKGNIILVDTSAPDAQEKITKLNLKTPSQRATEIKISTQNQQQISDEALDMEARKYAITGQMPALGMGNTNARLKIINKAAMYLRGQGIDPQTLPALQAEFKGAKDTYVAVKKATEQFSSFEKSMLKNMDYAVDLSSRYKRTSLPPVNTLVNAIRQKTGDPAVVKLGTAIYTAAMEFEKIRTAGTGITSAELSINAQNKAEEIINKSQTHEQLKAVLDAMKNDAKNVMDARRSTVKSLSDEMKLMQSSVGGQNAPGSNRPAFDIPLTGNKIKIGNYEVQIIKDK